MADTFELFSYDLGPEEGKKGITVSQLACYLSKLPAGFKQAKIFDSENTEYFIKRVYYDQEADELMIEFDEE